MRSDFHVFVGHRDTSFAHKVKELLANFYSVSISCSGHEIINTILELQPDLAVLDFEIPEIDVLNLCEKLSGNFPEIHTVIYVSLENIVIARKKWRKRALDYIIGPLQPEEFLEDVSKVVRYILILRERETLIRNKIELRYRLNNTLISLKQLVHQAQEDKDWNAVQSISNELRALETMIQDIDALS